MPHRVAIHGFLLLGEHKMSKSLGNVIEPFKVAELYGEDALRFYVLREVSFGADGEVSPEGFETRYTTELANEFGNLANRTLAMIGRYRDGVVPDAQPAPEIAAEFEGLSEAVGARIDAVEITAALDEIWRRVKRLNRYVTEEEPWKLAKDESQGERLDQVLYTLAEGLRVLSVLLHAFMPRSAERLLAALGREELGFEGARLGAVAGGAQLGELDQLFPRVELPRPLPDRHALPPRRMRGSGRRARAARARQAGVGRLATVGMNGPSIERALAAARDNEGVIAIVGRHPHESEGFDADDLDEIERAAADDAARAIGETGLDYFRDYAPREHQRRAFESQLELAARLGLPVVIHTRAAEDDTFAMLREHTAGLPAVIMHCFSAPARLEECVSAATSARSPAT